MESASDLLAVPPATHVLYIPFVLLVGVIVGFILGRKAGIREGKAQFLGGGPDDEDE
jgi:hypothetical protein